MEKETGGPAFPVDAELCQDLTVEEQRGMTLRDYFAARVMRLYSDDTPELMEQNAKRAYQQADAMLKAREQ